MSAITVSAPTIVYPPTTGTPGQILATYFRVRHPDGRCEGLTRRGTRCRFRASTILVRYTDGRQEGQHSACSIHKNTWRWW